MKLSDKLIPKYSSSPVQARKYLKKLIASRPRAVKKLKAGDIVAMKRYKAITVDIYDKNPVVLCLKSNSKYLIGFNINHLNRIKKEKLLRYMLKYNCHKRPRKLKQITKTKKPDDSFRKYFIKIARQKRMVKLTVYDFYHCLRINALKL